MGCPCLHRQALVLNVEAIKTIKSSQSCLSLATYNWCVSTARTSGCSYGAETVGAQLYCRNLPDSHLQELLQHLTESLLQGRYRYWGWP